MVIKTHPWTRGHGNPVLAASVGLKINEVVIPKGRYMAEASVWEHMMEGHGPQAIDYFTIEGVTDPEIYVINVSDTRVPGGIFAGDPMRITRFAVVSDTPFRIRCFSQVQNPETYGTDEADIIETTIEAEIVTE